jgi:PTS system cellobiose-specific IIC component
LDEKWLEEPMEKFMSWLQDSFAPRMNKVSRNIWITTLKDTMLQVLPFIFAGSIFCLGTIIENFVSLPFSFWTPFGWTMGLLSLFVAFLIPVNFCEKKRLRKTRLVAALCGVSVYLISITPQVIADNVVGFTDSALGAGGMFCAIVTGIYVCLIFNLFGKFSFFKEDSVIPDFVRQWFDSLLPIIIAVFVMFLIVQVAGVNLYAVVVAFFSPLEAFLNTWWGMALFWFITCFIYSMGISGWVLAPIQTPVQMSTIAANLALIAAGTATAENLGIFNYTLMFQTYMWWGGIGCTFPLVLLLMRSRSQRLKALGRACIAPAIFNINEPVVFGCVAWNPLLMVPMWINGAVIPLFTYLGVKVLQIAPFNNIQFDLWYCPYPIGTWISTQSFVAVIFVICSMLLAGLIWYPFFKVYEKQCLAEEAGKQGEVANA